MNELTYVKAARPARKGPTAKARAKRARAEGPVKRTVREQCVARDGYCRIWTDGVFNPYGTCYGPSEWAHFAETKRARTRGMKPEKRHNTAGSFMLCRCCHRNYDAGFIIITATTEAGCDGPLTYRWKAAA